MSLGGKNLAMAKSVVLNADGTVNLAASGAESRKETAAKRKILVQQLNKSVFGPTIRVAHFRRRRYRAAGRDFMQQKTWRTQSARPTLSCRIGAMNG